MRGLLALCLVVLIVPSLQAQRICFGGRCFDVAEKASPAPLETIRMVAMPSESYIVAESLPSYSTAIPLESCPCGASCNCPADCSCRAPQSIAPPLIRQEVFSFQESVVVAHPVYQGPLRKMFQARPIRSFFQRFRCHR